MISISNFTTFINLLPYSTYFNNAVQNATYVRWTADHINVYCGSYNEGKKKENPSSSVYVQ